MLLSVYSIIYFLSALTAFWLTFVLVKQKNKTVISKLVISGAIVIIIWALSQFLNLNSYFNNDIQLIIWRLNFALIFVLLAIFFEISILVRNIKIKTVFRYLLLAVYTFFVLFIFFTNYFIDNLKYLEYIGQFNFQAGSLFVAIIAFQGLLLVGAFYNYIQTYLQEQSKVRKKILRNILLAIGFLIVFILFNYVFLLSLEQKPWRLILIPAIIILFTLFKYVYPYKNFGLKLKNFKIRTKIALVFLVSIIIVSFSGIAFFHNSMTSNLSFVIHNNLESAVSDRAKHVQDYIEYNLNEFRLISSRTKLRSLLVDYNENPDPEYLVNINNIILDAQESVPGIKSIAVINLKGRVITSTEDLQVGLDYSNKNYFIQGLQDEHFFVLNETIDQETSIYLSGPLIFDGQVLGVILVKREVKNFYNILTNYDGWGETGETYLLNSNNTMITPSRFIEGAELKQEVFTANSLACSQKRVSSLKGGSADQGVNTKTFLDYKGVEALGTNVYLPEQDWCLLAEIYQSEALRSVRMVLFLSLFGGFLMLIIFFFVAYWLSRAISGPIIKLKKSVEIIEQGDLSHRTDIRSNDEIGDLSRAFDKMTLSIKRSRAEVDKKVKEQTKDIQEKADNLAKQKKAILNILEDVDEEKRKVELEKDRVKTILYSIGDGVFVVDKNLKITLFNEVAAEISGFDVQDVIGKKYDKILKFKVEKTNKKVDNFIKKAMSTGKIQEMTDGTILIHKQGFKVAVSDSASPLKNSQGKVIGCVVVFRDVTEERRINEAKTEFVSLASHQLRTPLSTINWYAEMLLAGDAGNLNKEQKSFLQEVYGSNQRMVALVNSLLNVSRLELGTFAIEPEKCKITEIADEAIKELKPKIKEKKIKFNKKYDNKIGEIALDKKLTFIIFQNLLSNAVKYTPAKGKVELEIINLNNELKIKVSDSGIGIPRSQQKHIFEKLFRADNVQQTDTEGTGLGLYIIKSILDQVGGSIKFKSEKDKGTTFYVVLPVDGMKKKQGTKTLN